MNIGNQFKKGFIVNFIGKYSQIFIELIITIFLARLLKPEEFGIVSIVFVFLNFFNILSNIGIGVSIIQFRNLEKSEISTLNNLSNIIGLIFSILFIFFRHFISEFYNNDIYNKLVPLMAIVIMLNSCKSVPENILRKNQRFALLNTWGIISSIMGSLIAILLAFNNFGVYSLIYKSILTNIILAVVFINRSDIKFDCSFSTTTIRRVFKYSVNQFMFNFVNYFTRNLDNILIGKVFGSEALGYYDRAYKLMRYPLDSMKMVVGPVLHPVLSQYQSDKNFIAITYMKLLEVFSLLFIPLVPILFVLGDEIIVILYGTGWDAAIPVFKVLSLTAGLQALASTTSAIFQSLSRTDLLFRSGVIINILTVGGIIIGLYGGIIGVATGFTIGYVLSFIFTFYILLNLLEVKIISFIKIMVVPMLIGIMIFGTMLSVEIFLLQFNALLRTFILSGISIISYFILLKFFKKDQIIISLIKRA